MLGSTKLTNLIFSDRDSALTKKCKPDYKLGVIDTFDRCILLIQYLERAPIYAVTITERAPFQRRTYFVALTEVERRELEAQCAVCGREVVVRKVESMLQPDLKQLLDVAKRDFANKRSVV